MELCQPQVAGFVRRLLHSAPGDPAFGTYDSIVDVDGKWVSTLRLSDKAKKAAHVKKTDYAGGGFRTKLEAETSAARLFWDDPRVQDRAKKLQPSKKTEKRRNACADHAKRKAQGYPA